MPYAALFSKVSELAQKFREEQYAVLDEIEGMSPHDAALISVMLYDDMKLSDPVRAGHFRNLLFIR